MIRLPTGREIASLYAKHRKIDLTKTYRRLTAATQVEEDQGSTVPDGFPGSTLGGGGGAGSLVDPERPELGTVKLTSVESAVAGRITPRTDAHHRRTISAYSLLESSLRQLEQATTLLDEMDEDRKKVPSPSGCELCMAAGVTDGGKPIAWDHKGTVGGKLDVEMHLCKAHHRYVDRHGEVPTPEQTRWHDQHGSWRVQVRRMEQLQQAIETLS